MSRALCVTKGKEVFLEVFVGNSAFVSCCPVVSDQLWQCGMAWRPCMKLLVLLAALGVLALHKTGTWEDLYSKQCFLWVFISLLSRFAAHPNRLETCIWAIELTEIRGAVKARVACLLEAQSFDFQLTLQRWEYTEQKCWELKCFLSL